MKTCSKPPLLLLLKLMYITSLLPVLEAQEVKVPPEVTGYLERDVTLPCRFIPGPNQADITQVQWAVKQMERNQSIIVVSSPRFGVNVHETFLKGRVEMAEQSLIIKDVEMGDAGSYTCTVATFPSGSFEGTTNLVVLREQMALSSGEVSAIVIAVLLLLVITAAIAYFIIIRRPGSSVRQRVYIDTDGSVRDPTRPSVIAREEDVVYSDVKLKPSRDATLSSNDKHTETAHADDVTYSEVVVMRL